MTLRCLPKADILLNLGSALLKRQYDLFEAGIETPECVTHLRQLDIHRVKSAAPKTISRTKYTQIDMMI